MSLKKVVTVALLSTIAMIGCGGTIANSDEKKPYADASIFVEPEWLNAHLDDPSVLILDARGPNFADSEHIQGAHAINWQQFASVAVGKPGDSGWGLVVSPTELSPKLDSLGITASKKIVVYANNTAGWGEDGRIVWMLRMAGLDSAKILNGGFTYWKSRNFTTSTAKSTAPTSSGFTVTEYDSSYTITKADLAAHLSTYKIIDARAADEYAGAINYGEKRGGHIPGATLFTFNQAFQSDALVRSQNELENLFSAAGLKTTDTIVTYCTKGIRSAHLALILRAAGFKNARNYDGSFYEWAGDTSVAVVK